jgi:uridylate kinase
VQVLDETAFTLCKDNDIPVVVFNLQPGNIIQAMRGCDALGTIVDAAPDRLEDLQIHGQ